MRTPKPESNERINEIELVIKEKGKLVEACKTLNSDITEYLQFLLTSLKKPERMSLFAHREILGTMLRNVHRSEIAARINSGDGLPEEEIKQVIQMNRRIGDRVIEVSSHLSNIAGFCDRNSKQKIDTAQKLLVLSPVYQLRRALPLIVGVEVDF